MVLHRKPQGYWKKSDKHKTTQINMKTLKEPSNEGKSGSYFNHVLKIDDFFLSIYTLK